jgi:uncharacterized metal-binding protein YceD (DUF177 family)
MPKTPKPLPPEWSFFVDAEKIGASPHVISIHPNDAERKALAQRLGIKALDSLQAEISFIREPGKMTVHAEGSFEADVTQECVISRKPVKNRVNETFKAWFADKAKALSFARARQDKLLEKGNTEMPVLDESEDPEPIVEGKIDAGELVAQYLSLAIDPYPHAEGVAYDLGDEGEKGPKPGFTNPFAALKDWKAGKD